MNLQNMVEERFAREEGEEVFEGIRKGREGNPP
jgi:hypothetical protein